jgi:putative NADH-flavin reductase
MKITIFGASGRTGQQLVRQALEKGDLVTAFVRRPESLNLQHPNLKIITGTLDNQEKLKESIAGADACLIVLGGNSLTRHAVEIIAGIDRIVNTMEECGVKRFIYLSSIGAGESRFYMLQPIRFFIADLMLRVPLADHNANENRIVGSSLQWTVVRPGGLTDGPFTGNLKHGSEKITLKGNANISRANVAAFMLEQTEDTTYINKAVWLQEIQG